MYGLPDLNPSATARLHEQLMSSRIGQRWERMLRLHVHEVQAVLAVHTEIREDVTTALELLCASSALDADTTRAVERVLDDLQRHASVPLQRDLTRMRDELLLARGRTLLELVDN